MGAKQSCHVNMCENEGVWKIFFNHESLIAFNETLKTGALDETLKALEALFNNVEKLRLSIGKITTLIGDEGGEIYAYLCQECYESIDFKKLPCGWIRDRQRHVPINCFGMGTQHF